MTIRKTYNDSSAVSIVEIVVDGVPGVESALFDCTRTATGAKYTLSGPLADAILLLLEQKSPADIPSKS